MKIRKGDNVKVLSGKDRGKTGKVLEVSLPEERIKIEGVNMVKKHIRAKKQGEKGQRVSVESTVHISNAQIVCPSCGKPARIGSKMVENKKLRMCKKCQQEF